GYLCKLPLKLASHPKISVISHISLIVKFQNPNLFSSLLFSFALNAQLAIELVSDFDVNIWFMLKKSMTQLLTRDKYLTVKKMHTTFTRCGFSVRRCHTYKRNENNSEYIYRREFICHQVGIVNQQKVNELKKQRKRKSSRFNCNVKFFITKIPINFEERWVVTYFSNSNNHALLDDKEVRFLPAYHDIPNNDQSRILLLSKVDCSISIIIGVLELENGIEACCLPYLEKDIRNFLQSQSSVGNENDASNVLKLCRSLKDIDDVFQYDFTMDESNKLEYIIWVFGDSIRAYEAFGDVVVFDTTYRINCYDMPLGLWVRIDNHGNSILFGCVLLRDEKIHSFIWDLKVGVGVNIRNQAGEEARMRQKYHNPQIRTSFLIEEHAANILTPYAFELLQLEIELSSKYTTTKVDSDSYIVRHHTELDGGRLVSLIKEKGQESIHCSCREFEFCGILCRHGIRGLLKNDYIYLSDVKFCPAQNTFQNIHIYIYI
ncbi:hypothetical protein Lal_00016860, partial [Lupinus albus]